ncbi:hypothetical protein VPNG_07174 [Cytospora leucostoma]|uniref:Dystroglycan-type cadherin-like domain-containing protein n=1 Tax=Cytospora leucostoma TaxID=1230097 RepID=A0A423WJJ1_9PEZI|nr:hypothetical protein VPNG_07174 [Cytospora leucostoma]
MRFWVLLYFWYLVFAGLQDEVSAREVNLERAVGLAALEEPAPSSCFYYTYTWLATGGAPFTTPLHLSWEDPGSLPTGSPPQGNLDPGEPLPGSTTPGNLSPGDTSPEFTASGNTSEVSPTTASLTSEYAISGSPTPTDITPETPTASNPRAGNTSLGTVSTVDTSQYSPTSANPTLSNPIIEETTSGSHPLDTSSPPGISLTTTISGQGTVPLPQSSTTSFPGSSNLTTSPTTPSTGSSTDLSSGQPEGSSTTFSTGVSGSDPTNSSTSSSTTSSTGFSTTSSMGSFSTGPSIVAPTGSTVDITVASGRYFSLDLVSYLNDSSDVVLSLTTQPFEDWIQLDAVQRLIYGTAPSVPSELTVEIAVVATSTSNAARAAVHKVKARDTAYTLNVKLTVEPVLDVPITTGNPFSISLGLYLEDMSDRTSIATEPLSNWIAYDSSNQVVSGIIPNSYVTTETNITVNAVSRNGTAYSRYFVLVIEPVQSLREVTGNSFLIHLDQYLLASSDNVTSAIPDPTASWIIFNSATDTLSGTVPTSLNHGSFLITINAESTSKGLSYSFQLRLAIEDISQDSSVRVPVVASNAFTINMIKYFPASSQLTAIDTNPEANWIDFDDEENIVYGLVPDFAAETVVALTVNASSTGSSDSSTALYTRGFSLVIQDNDIPDYNVTLGNEFVIDLSLELLSEPGDYLASVSTVPTSDWVALSPDNRNIAGTVPITLAAGSSVSVTGNAINPSLGSSYGKQYSLVIAAGKNITVPVVVGDGFQVNLTEYLQNTGDTILPITLSPEVNWVTLKTGQPPYLYGTVPKDYAGSEVNSTVIAVSQVTGLTYSLLVTLEVFATKAILEFDPAEPFVINLVPLLQASSDLVNSIQTYPEVDWISLDAANRSLSGLVPPTQPSGTTVNITVDAVTAGSNAANKRDLNGLLSRQTETESDAYSILLSLLIAERDEVNSTTSSALPSSTLSTAPSDTVSQLSSILPSDVASSSGLSSVLSSDTASSTELPTISGKPVDDEYSLISEYPIERPLVFKPAFFQPTPIEYNSLERRRLERASSLKRTFIEYSWVKLDSLKRVSVQCHRVEHIYI